jgi:hypothetical protein
LKHRIQKYFNDFFLQEINKYLALNVQFTAESEEVLSYKVVRFSSCWIDAVDNPTAAKRTI